MQLVVKVRQHSTISAPYDHNQLLSAAVNEAMRAHHAEFWRKVHGSTERSKYSIGELYHRRDRRGEASFRMSSPDERLLRQIGGALVSTGKMQIGKSEYRVVGAEAPLQPEVLAPFGVHTLSPVWIRDRNSPRSLVHDNCDYPATLASVINHDIQKLTKRSGTIQVLNMDKLEVRKRTLAGRTVLAQKGTFWLHGSPEDLQHVLDWGVGHGTAMGFGCVVGELP